MKLPEIPRRIQFLIGGVFLVVGLGILYTFNPAGNPNYPPCPTVKYTGLYCPGCGSLRGTHAMLNGDLATAMRMNPLLVISIPFLGALILVPRWTLKPWVPWFSLAVLVLYGILRNLPYWPFSWLAPG